MGTLAPCCPRARWSTWGAATGPASARAAAISSAVRTAVPVFQPQDEALAALSARVQDAFDPKCVLNPGRMYAGI